MLVYCDEINTALTVIVMGLVGCGLIERSWGIFETWLRSGASHMCWDVGACDYCWGAALDSCVYGYVGGVRDNMWGHELYGITAISIRRGPHTTIWWLGA